MRLIDADEAVKAVHDEFDECLVWDESGATTANEFENIILQIPTVDAVPVVRCKDCKHYHADPWGYGNCVFEGGVSRRTKTSDFCSWGERREDE